MRLFGSPRHHTRFHKFSSLSAHPPTIHFLAKENVCYKGFISLLKKLSIARWSPSKYSYYTIADHYARNFKVVDEVGWFLCVCKINICDIFLNIMTSKIVYRKLLTTLICMTAKQFMLLQINSIYKMNICLKLKYIRLFVKY